MASSTTINAWTDELVRSFIPSTTSPSKTKRIVEQFSRSIKHHNYARTNQYDVEDRLTGLEEKFQILNNDDLSDALRGCRSELQDHQSRWLPDILDFLLRLSNDPVRKTRIPDSSPVENRHATPSPISWSDIEADDPIDWTDKIWHQPTFSAEDSEEEDVVLTSTATSPASIKQTRKKVEDDSHRSIPLTTSVTPEDAKTVAGQVIKTASSDHVYISETAAVRELLFMAQGLPSAMFRMQEGLVRRQFRYKLSHLSDSAVDAACEPIMSLRAARDRLDMWTRQPHQRRLMQVLETETRSLLGAFDQKVSSLHSQVIATTETGGVVSFLQNVDALRLEGQPIGTLERLIARVKDGSPLAYMDSLYNSLDTFDSSDDYGSFSALQPAFKAMLVAYGKSLANWVEHGVLTEGDSHLFARKASDQKDKAKLWHSWFTQEITGPNSPPRFLKSLAEQAFVAGKTQAFLSALGSGSSSTMSAPPPASFDSIIESLSASPQSLLPFAASFQSQLSNYITTRLHHNSILLRTKLLQQHSLDATLSILSALYLASSPTTISLMDHHVFTNLLRSSSHWNDRFLLTELLSTSLPSIPHERIIVHSTPLSSTTLRSTRSSVKVLENLAIDYLLPWPIANIIPPDTLSSYRRVSLLLSQIRYAKYTLEHHAYPHLRTAPLSAQALFLNLHVFVAILYSHFTTTVVAPMTTNLHRNITEAETVDDMIQLHETYLHTLEYACLATKNLKVLRDTVTSALDLCLGFGLGGMKPSTTREGVQKTKKQFRKHVEFLIAGLRGVARGAEAGSRGKGDGTAAGMELLADRLDAAGFR